MHPLLKAALFAIGIDDFARVALLRTSKKYDRLLVTVDRIGRQIKTDVAPRHQIPSNEPSRHLAFKGKEWRLSTPNATNLGIKGKATLSQKPHAS
jgi:hypothetical protein